MQAKNHRVNTRREQYNEGFIRKIIHKTIEIVYQTPFNLLSKFGTKELKKLENVFKEINKM